ncbi:Noc2p family domain containing protein [Elaphomyces granulatus]|jgi:nucleolar complex protein 2
MAGRAKKSTRKFEKKHLQDTLDRRKEFAKIKQRHQQKEKKKTRNTKKREQEATRNEKTPEQIKAEKAFAEMNVDDFFAGGFNVPSTTPEKQKTRKNDVSSKNGKRKRSQDEENDEEEGDTSVSIDESEEEITQSENDASSQTSSVGDMEEHKGQLEALKKKDPEFYKYLEGNDAELLAFGDHEDLAEVDELSDTSEEPPAKKKKKEKLVETDVDVTDGMLTTAMVKKWQRLMEEQYSMKALRQVVQAFRSAAYVNEAEIQNSKYSISDPDVYHQVLITALEMVPKVLSHHLPSKEMASGKVRLSFEAKKFKTLTPLIKSHISSVHQLLANLSDAATLKLTLSSIEPMLPYLLQFRKLLKVIIKPIIGIWSDFSNTEATRITAFLLIRRLMVIGDAGIRETVLKAAYEGVVKGSHKTTVHTAAGVNLLKNSAAEIWGIDQNISYTTGFTFIRQLAIHLRGSITNPSKDSYKKIYNWQYVHSLDFWSRVLSQHCDALVEATAGKPSALRPLIYPVVQITIGAMRLIPTPQYFPLRFHLTRALLRISRTTGTYIPLAPYLLEVLNSSEMRKSPKSSTLKPLEFNTSIRAPKPYLRTRIYQDGVGEQVAELLSEFFVLWTKHIAFPELSLPIVVMLKRWLREGGSRTSGNKNTKLNQMILLLVQKVELNTRWIEDRRAKVTFAPKDRAEVDSFLKEVAWETSPLGAFVKSQRKLREERVAIVEKGRIEEEQRRTTKKGSEDDEFMEDVDSEDDESDE